MNRPPQRMALLCVDPWQVEDSHDHRPFNYAVRRIQAAILGHPDLQHIDLTLLETSSLDVDAFVERLEDVDPDIIGVSAYVWSFPILLEVCRRAKLARPDRLVIFGGPSAYPEMFELPQHRQAAGAVDVLVLGFGESTIQELLLGLSEPRARENISGLALRTAAGFRATNARKQPLPDVHPSPYQMGLMPRRVTGQLESFRGCPLACSFCEWGSNAGQNTEFGREYLVRELAALGQLDARGSWLVDAALNLNARAFRNLRQAEAEVGALRAAGSFRCEVYPSRLNDEHLTFLQDVRAVYAGLGLQSLDAEVLKSVNRPFRESRFFRVVEELSSIVPDTTVELILGLPGDTPDGFKRTLDQVRQLPVSIRVFHCLVLPNAMMKSPPAGAELVYDPFSLQLISARGWSRSALAETIEWLNHEATDESGEVPHGGTWKFQRAGVRRGEHSVDLLPDGVRDVALPHEGGAPIHPELSADLRLRLADADVRLLQLVALGPDVRSGLCLCLDTPHGAIKIELVPDDPVQPAYLRKNGLALSYLTGQARPTAEAIRAAEAAIVPLLDVLAPAILGFSTVSAARGHVLPLFPTSPPERTP